MNFKNFHKCLYTVFCKFLITLNVVFLEFNLVKACYFSNLFQYSNFNFCHLVFHCLKIPKFGDPDFLIILRLFSIFWTIFLCENLRVFIVFSSKNGIVGVCFTWLHDAKLLSKVVALTEIFSSNFYSFVQQLCLYLELYLIFFLSKCWTCNDTLLLFSLFFLTIKKYMWSFLMLVGHSSVIFLNCLFVLLTHCLQTY